MIMSLNGILGCRTIFLAKCIQNSSMKGKKLIKNERVSLDKLQEKIELFAKNLKLLAKLHKFRAEICELKR